ncbi:MAG: HEAT repeat domain-containing protein [Ignavibacteriaceae bacterium]|jgi:HEAT repeat protein
MRTTYESIGTVNFQAIPDLAKDLFSKNYLLRKKAREELVEIGDPSLEILKDLANNGDQNARWEAIITIVQIGSNETLGVLLKALDDEEFSIRWLAAEGLANLGKISLMPLLRKLRNNPDSGILRRGSFHVLRELMKKGIFKDEFNLINLLADDYQHKNISYEVDQTINSYSRLS